MNWYARRRVLPCKGVVDNPGQGMYNEAQLNLSSDHKQKIVFSGMSMIRNKHNRKKAYI